MLSSLIRASTKDSQSNDRPQFSLENIQRTGTSDDKTEKLVGHIKSTLVLAECTCISVERSKVT